MKFPAKAAAFMRELQANNDRDWFAANKSRYEAAKEEVLAFAKTVQTALAETDELEPGKSPLMRIYRDTRFSKDKTPYKRFWGGGMDRLGQERRGGYYWHVEPGGLEYFPEFKGGEAFVGGGFWAPESADLKRIRQELSVDHLAFRQMLASPPVSNSFDGLYPSSMLKTTPQGIAKDHPALDLLKHKNFVLVRIFSAKETHADNFSEQVAQTFIDMRPFLDYMTDVLSTDANGERI